MKWRTIGIFLTAVVLLAVSMVPAFAEGPTVATGITPCDDPSVLFPPVRMSGLAGFTEGLQVLVWKIDKGEAILLAQTTVKSWPGWGTYYMADLAWDCPSTPVCEGIVMGSENVVAVQVGAFLARLVSYPSGKELGLTATTEGRDGESLLVNIYPSGRTLRATK